MGKRKREKEKIKKIYKKIKRLLQENKENESEAESNHLPPESDMSTSSTEVQGSVVTPTTSSADPIADVPLIQQIEIDQDVLSAMGEIETVQEKGPSVHVEIVNRWSPILKKGLKKEEKTEILKKYLPFENLPLMIPPKLNPELSAGVSDPVRKRDIIIEERQKQISAALSALGQGLQLFLTKGKYIDIIKCVNDASKILCDSIHKDTASRRSLISGVVNKDLKDSLLGEPDTLLFGTNLGERIKNTKAIQRSGLDLKANLKPQNYTNNKPSMSANNQQVQQFKTLNWRVPPRRILHKTGGKVSQPTSRSAKKQTEKKQSSSGYPHRR